VAVSEDHGTPRADTVDVLEIVGIEDAATLPDLDEKRRAADTAERADGRVHTTRNHFLSTLKERLRLLSHAHRIMC
jgi:hypothetical protein